ncbi:hypothetical protein BCS71_25840 [Vibrio lentus]
MAKLKASDTEQVLNLTIDKFSDELGNSGVVQTKTSAVKVTPLIEVTEPKVMRRTVTSLRCASVVRRNDLKNSAKLTLSITPLVSDPLRGGHANGNRNRERRSMAKWQRWTLSGLSNAGVSRCRSQVRT